MDARGARGVVAVVLAPRPLTDAESVPARALSSCFAVIPIYRLARDPAVILLSKPALALVLAPRAVRVGGRSTSSSPTTLGRAFTAPETALAVRAGVVVEARILRSKDGVARPEGVALPLSEYEADEEARER